MNAVKKSPDKVNSSICPRFPSWYARIQNRSANSESLMRFTGMLKHVPHPSGVEVPQVSSPMRFADASMKTMAAPPLLGQHSDDILADLGNGTADIAALRAAGAI